jgi:hypothetical protein
MLLLTFLFANTPFLLGGLIRQPRQPHPGFQMR